MSPISGLRFFYFYLGLGYMDIHAALHTNSQCLKFFFLIFKLVIIFHQSNFQAIWGGKLSEKRRYIKLFLKVIFHNLFNGKFNIDVN